MNNIFLNIASRISKRKDAEYSIVTMDTLEPLIAKFLQYLRQILIKYHFLE